MRKTNKRHRGRQHHYFRSKRFFLWLGMGLCVSIAVAWGINKIAQPEESDNWFEVKASANKIISLPEDDKPHKEKVEWWYYNGIMTTGSGLEYSYHAISTD